MLAAQRSDGSSQRKIMQLGHIRKRHTQDDKHFLPKLAWQNDMNHYYSTKPPDERQYYNRLDSWRKERHLNTIHIVRGAMEAVDAGEKGLPHPRLINREEKRVAWENRVILAEEKRIAAEANRVYVKVDIAPSKDERFKNYRGRYGAVRSD